MQLLFVVERSKAMPGNFYPEGQNNHHRDQLSPLNKRGANRQFTQHNSVSPQSNIPQFPTMPQPGMLPGEKMPVFAPMPLLQNGGQPSPSLRQSADTQRPSVSRRFLSGKNRLLFIGILVALCMIPIALLGGLFLLSKSTMSVTLYQVGSQNVTQYVGGGGIIYPQQQVDISYPDAERVVNVFVKPGDVVNINQPLIGLDPTQLNIQVKQAADEVAAAQAYLDTVSAAGNSVAIAQAQQEYALAQSRYNALVAQTSSLMQHGGNLVSPINGVVTEVDVNTGDIFTGNQQLLTIMDETNVIVHVEIPLANLGQVSVGQQAVVTPSALPSMNLRGQVISIIPLANAQTDTFEVWVSVPNPDHQLLPGMSAFVRIQENGKAIVVPRLAVLNPDRDSVVFVVQKGIAHIQKVHIVGYAPNEVYIDKGLSSGEQVVLVGIYALQDGQTVRVKSVEHS